MIRSLGRRGIGVEIAWCPAHSPARRSRYVSFAHDLPIPTGEDDAWLGPFVELLDARTFDLVVPCDDPTTVPLQTHRDELETHAPLYLLSPRAFETTTSKELTYELAHELGIPLPRQEVVSTSSELDAAADRLGFPLVLKPDRSFSSDDLVSRQGHVKIRSAEELGDAARRVPGIAQEHVDGEGIGVSVLASDGEILVDVRRVRECVRATGRGIRRRHRLSPGMPRDANSVNLEVVASTGNRSEGVCRGRTRKTARAVPFARSFSQSALPAGGGAKPTKTPSAPESARYWLPYRHPSTRRALAPKVVVAKRRNVVRRGQGNDVALRHSSPRSVET